MILELCYRVSWLLIYKDPFPNSRDIFLIIFYSFLIPSETNLILRAKLINELNLRSEE